MPLGIQPAHLAIAVAIYLTAVALGIVPERVAKRL